MAHERAAEPEQAQVSSAQQSSARALNEAADAQKRAQSEQTKAEDAHQAVLRAQQDLSNAEANWRAAELHAQQAQEEARRTSEASSSQASSSQQQAMDAQQNEDQLRTNHEEAFHEQHAKLVGRGELNGTLARVGSDSVEIQAPDRGRISLAVDAQTDVRLDGQSSSVDQLPEGANIRAAYDTRQGTPTATRIDVTTGAQEPTKPAPSDNEPSPDETQQQ